MERKTSDQITPLNFRGISKIQRIDEIHFNGKFYYFTAETFSIALRSKRYSVKQLPTIFHKVCKQFQIPKLFEVNNYFLR